MSVKGAGFFGNQEIAEALITKGLAAKFTTAVQAGDRNQVIGLLAKVTRDKGGQTAEVLADLYLTGKTPLPPLKP
ncbi:hypothetical protein [Caulobacter soli]|uniref:hypothetical protein n=1 Tax=Caulobacter soli TaxID=2708539 RepID=UPI0013ED8F24|nr:hypothetical protein [Caulobacter soli]